MMGPSESRPPREKRKADPKHASRSGSSYAKERAIILLLYAAKIAAARLYTAPDELEAVLASLKSEEHAALNALREREHIQNRKRRTQRLGWRLGAQACGRGAHDTDPTRPRQRRRAFRRLRRQPR
jgi:hypothetical protein